MTATTDLDRGPLAWVKGEIDLALGHAQEALGQFAESPGDSAPLKFARTHLHQARGALSIVGLDGVTQFAEAVEELLADVDAGRLAAAPDLAERAQRALGAIRHYLDELATGAPNQPLRLLPAYGDVLAARGVERVAAADLFFPDLSLRPPRRAQEPAPLPAAGLKAERARFERGFLKWLRHADDPAGLAEMRQAVAAIEATQALPAARAFWWVTLGLLDALATGRIPVDFHLKKLCARVDLQMRRLLEGSPTVSERLMRDALYFVAVARDGGEQVQRVKAAYRLDELVPAAVADIEPLQPVLRAMREALGAAKEAWNKFCAGAAVALPQFHEHAQGLASRGGGLVHEHLARLTAAVAEAAQWLRKDPLKHSDAAAMEVATALLLVENALDNYEQLGADFPRQAQTVVGRLGALMRGEALPALDAPLLDEISRRAQERLLMGQVAREILNNLVQIEETLDGFFRDASHRGDLPALAAPLKQVEGALTILGQDRAVALLRECAARVQAFAGPEHVPQAEECEEVAHKLSGLGFFVEALQHGPADLDGILQPLRPAVPAAAETALEEEGPAPSVEAELERQKREAQALVEALREKPGDEGVREELKQHLETMRQDASLVADGRLEQEAKAALAALAAAPAEAAAGQVEEAVARVAPAAPAPSAETLRLAEAPREEIDAELLAIFLEEAHEVLASIGQALARSLGESHDHDCLITIRRGFHTLKGSGRMVGLTELGEAAWAVEQVMNQWLQLERDASPALHRLIGEAHARFGAWVAEIESGGGREGHPDAVALIALAGRLREGEDITAEAAAPAPAAPIEAETLAAQAPEAVALGDLVLSRTLYDMYVGEARGHVAALRAGLNTLKLVAQVPPEAMVRAAHTLAGISGTVGIGPVNRLGLALEHALHRLARSGQPCSSGQIGLLGSAVSTLEAMVAAVAEQRVPHDADGLARELNEVARALQPAAVELTLVPAVEPPPVAAEPPAPPPAEAAPEPAPERRRLRLHDELDAQLLPIFLEEATDLLREIGKQLRNWSADPNDDQVVAALARLLHTLKGSARMAGAMGMGELIHGMETRIEEAVAAAAITPAFLEELDTAYDRANVLLEALHGRGPAGETAGQAAGMAAPQPEGAPAEEPEGGEAAAGRALLRVRTELIDRLVNEAGEMSIVRSRIEGEMRILRDSLRDLTENVIRLRGQLREVEIQAESQMQSRLAQAQEVQGEFDPLEFDRFTRFQELTRMMAESVNDVTTVQHTLLRNLDHADAAIVSQARLNRELSQALMGVRMVPFNSLAERLYRVVRQTAKELSKKANLDIRGGQVELDRSVLEKMTGPIEHLLRNAVAHGLEDRQGRLAAGKPEIGELSLALAQEGNEVVIELADDGAGLDFECIRAKAVGQGLLGADERPDEAALTQFIFQPGFSTARELTELAGRGVGMDVVKSQAAELGGRIEAASSRGQGVRFRIYLPLTLAVAQAVLVRAGGRSYAIPSVMVEQVLELKAEAVQKIRAGGAAEWLGNRYPYHFLPRLLGEPQAMPEPQRRYSVLLLRAGVQRIAVEVDELRGNQEIVIKNAGPQLARVVGIAGATVRGDGQVLLILNPIALAGREIKAVPGAAAPAAAAAAAARGAHLPTVMVVDDSLTVRKITGRLLAREGYQVLTAKDGVDALEQLLDIVPDAMLVDIEMPRMDGFDLTRHVRADARLKRVPIIMITSRIAEKHRNYARELGVDHYLGKPYQEEELLRLIAGYVRRPAAAPA